MAGSVPVELLAHLRRARDVADRNYAEPLDLTGLVVLDIDDASLQREVAMYWYDAITLGGAGMELHRVVVALTPQPHQASPPSACGSSPREPIPSLR